jgi:AraC family transcriptional regulator
LHESISQKGDSAFVPAGQTSYWLCKGSENYRPMLNIHLKPELVEQVAEGSEIDPQRFTLINGIGQQNLQLHQVAMLLLAELQSGGIMGRLYVESLTQALVIHLLRHYSTVTQTITSENRNLTHVQLQQLVQTWDRNFSTSVCDSTASGKSERDVVENGSGDYPKGNLLRKPQISPYKWAFPAKVT